MGVAIMDKQNQELLLKLARESILENLSAKPSATLEFLDKEKIKELSGNEGAFVTLNKGEALRGCIGNIIGTKPLYRLIYRLAKESAFGDYRYFDPTENWYLERAQKMLKTIKKHNKRVEINTGAVARRGATHPYPSPTLLKECTKLEIPMVLSSDAHNPINLSYYFDESKELMKQSGYKSKDVLINGNWQSVKLN
jgi:hypothetical protein